MDPEREIVTGYSFGDINATFQCSSDMREKNTGKHGNDLHTIQRHLT